MYASKAIIALALAATAAPALGFSYESLAAREEDSLLARNMNVVRSVGEAVGMKRSEIEDIVSRSLHDGKHGHQLHDAKHGAKHGHKHGSKQGAHHARAEKHHGQKHAGQKHHGAKHGHKAHGAKHHKGSKAHSARELLTRQTQAVSTTDESGAIDIKTILGDVAKGAATVLPFFLRREEMDMFARATATPAPADDDDESGAIDVKTILGDVAKGAATILPFFLKREELEMLARQATDDESGAINVKTILGDVAKGAATVLPFFLKREEMARSLNDLD